MNEAALGRDVPDAGWERRWPPPGYWVKVGVALIVAVVAIRMLAVLQSVLLLIAASFVLAIGLQPAISWFERRGVRRGLGLAAVLTGLLAVFGGMLALVVPLIVSQLANLLAELPAYVQRVEESDGAVGRLVELFNLEALSDGSAADPETAMDVIGSVASFVFNFVTVVLVTPYLAMSWPSIKRWMVRLLRPRHREDFVYLLNQSTDLIANYIVGNLIVSLIAGTVTWLGLRAIGVPFALALAAWVALTDLIPILGAVLGAAGVAAVAAFSGPEELAWSVGLLVVYQQVENYVIAPRVMKRAVDLSPAAVIVALMVGGTLAGLVGALLALPLAAMVKVVLLEYVVEERLEQVRAEVASVEGRRRRPRGRNGSRPLP